MKRIGFKRLCVLFLLTIIGQMAIMATISQAEHDALMDLYNSTGGQSWYNSSGWGGALGTENTWYGVVTDAGNTIVLQLNLDDNNLKGSLPNSLSNLVNLTILEFGGNALTGDIPDLHALTGLKELWVSYNPNLNPGPIPLWIFNLTELEGIGLAETNRTAIPPEIGNLKNLNYLYLDDNQISSIPPEIGNLSNLWELSISDNQVSSIPQEIANLRNLNYLNLKSNAIVGEIPSTFINLTNLYDSEGLDIRWNALYSSDDTLTAFLAQKQGEDWRNTQTVAPTAVSAGSPTNNSIIVSWTPITYLADSGGYEVYYSTASGGSYMLKGVTSDKTVSSMLVDGLLPGTKYYFVVKTKTDSHENNQNTVESDYSSEVSATTSGGCHTNTGSLSGYVAIGDAQSIYILNGQDVSGTIKLVSNDGTTFTSQLTNGEFHFDSIPVDSYSLSGEISYYDNILYDAQYLSYGCLSPSGQKIQKKVTLPRSSVEVLCDTSTQANIYLKQPIVMIHGTFDCYKKFYSDDTSDPQYQQYFDNYARTHGFISFTPNYNWWDDSWLSRAQAVEEQIREDLTSLTGGRDFPPYTVVAYDMGGLVLRVMTNNSGAEGRVETTSLPDKIKNAYLIGVPNSGADYNEKLGKNGILGTNPITTQFNEVYPDFGKINPTFIAGTNGLWGSKNNDSVISIDSATNIKMVSCKEDDCVTYSNTPIQSKSFLLNYNHKSLASPPSIEDIFGIILSTREGRPEVPVGPVGWGTVGCTSSTLTNKGRTSLKESEQIYPFTVGKCNGIAIVIQISEGSGDFYFIDPDGMETEIKDNIFVQLAPKAGECNLRVIPSSQGLTFDAIVIEDSIFGIKGYLTSFNYFANDNAIMRVDKIGDWSGVSSTSATAKLVDGSGNILQNVSLIDKGIYFSGEVQAPETSGSYTVLIEAKGIYEGSNFTRVEILTLNVVSQSYILSGQFSDEPLDLDGNGKYDSILINSQLNFTTSGSFVLIGDLYDSDGNFISHSSNSFTSISGSQEIGLTFDLRNSSLSQFSNPFELLNLKLLDAETLSPIDVWGNIVKTKLYSGSTFECSTAPLSPVIDTIFPSRGTIGSEANIVISGKNFSSESTLEFNPHLEVLNINHFSNKVLYATISIPSSATEGSYDVIIKNPDGKNQTLKNSFYVDKDKPPQITLQISTITGKIGGIQQIGVNIVADSKVVSVEYFVDGISQTIATAFPFLWQWNTNNFSVGTHKLKAVATDSMGQKGSVEQDVEVIRYPQVITISKLSDPFRIKLTGSNFQSSMKVYINDILWTNVKWKSQSVVIIKGGKSLKKLLKKGEKVKITLVNPDGGEISLLFSSR